MSKVELLRSVPDVRILEALRDALFDTACLLVGLPKEGDPPRVQVVAQVEVGTRTVGLNLFIPEALRAAVEGRGGETLDALSRIAHEVAAQRWGGSAEVLLFSPPTLEEIDGSALGDWEVLRGQRRQAAPERVAMMLQDWLELLCDEEEDARLRWDIDSEGSVEIIACVASAEARDRLRPEGDLGRALAHLTERLGEALGCSCQLRSPVGTF